MRRLILPLLLCLVALVGALPSGALAASALTISDIRVLPGATSATVTWTTSVSAGGAVFYGPAAEEWTEPVASTGDGLSHSATISGLEPATLYRFRISAYRADGTNVFSTPQTFTTSAVGATTAAPAAVPSQIVGPAAGPVVSDDFNRSSGRGIWAFVNPRGDASYTLTGTDLRIYVPDGAAHEPWSGGSNAVRMLQPALDGDFDIIAKFNSRVTGHIAMQGLIVQADDSNYVRFDISSTRDSAGAERVGLFAGRITAGTGQALASKNSSTIPALLTANPIYLRMARVGTNWGFSYSTNGTTWAPFYATTLDQSVTSVGLFAGNAQPSQNRYAQPFVASVDYFHNAAAPLADDPVAIADTSAPLIFLPPHTVSGTGAKIDWFTDEPATARLEYSSKTAAGGVQTAPSAQAQSFSLSGLQPATIYSYTATATNAAGKTSQATGVFYTPPAATGGNPVVDVWYGDTQAFGARGNPQRWVNILGKVSDADGFDRTIANFGTAAWPLRYSLNGGPEQSLMIGPGSYADNFLNYRRLYNQGDFNVEIDRSSLLAGANTVVISATDTLGNTTARSVTVQYTAGQTWPIPYTVDWSQATSLGSVAQPVDGLWALESDSVRPVERGYDRLLAVGDVSWTDFEVTVPITIHQIDMYSGERYNSGGPGVGMIVRWQGHYDSAAPQQTQPRWLYYPLGGLGWYRLDRIASGSSQYETHLHIDTGAVSVFARDPERQKLIPGRQYIFKMRVQTGAGVGGGDLYSMKVWEACTAEPTTWTASGTPAASDQPLAQGSLLLVAHHVDASFGDVWVRPVGGTEALPTCDAPAPPPGVDVRLWLPMLSRG